MSNDRSPVLSVVMPVRNGMPYLDEAIQSILGQTFSNFEFIVIDDGSLDETPERLAQYTSTDKRMVIIRNENSMGLPRALNQGLSIARGDFIARQDADDQSHHERFSRQLDILARDPRIAILGTNAMLIDDRGGFIRNTDLPAQHDEIIKGILSNDSPFVHGSWMFRKECLKRVGYYDELLFSAEDKDYWLRIGEQFQTFNSPDCLYNYRVHGGAFTNANSIRRGMNRLLVTTLARERQRDGKDSFGCPFGGVLNQSGISANMVKAIHELNNASLALERRAVGRFVSHFSKAAWHGKQFGAVRHLLKFLATKFFDLLKKKANRMFSWMRLGVISKNFIIAICIGSN